MKKSLIVCLLTLMVLPAASLSLLRATTTGGTTAKDSILGMYATLSIKANGVDVKGHAPEWLGLHSDKSYSWGLESGHYTYSEDGISFNGTRSQWGKGKIDNGGNITFEFKNEGKNYTVVFFRVK